MMMAKAPKPHRYLWGDQIWRSSVSNPERTVLQSCSVGNKDGHGEVNHAKTSVIEHKIRPVLEVANKEGTSQD
jgi:hypothetical protein